MKISKLNLRNLFKKGLKPTEDAFYNLFDSYHHKDELIPQESVSGLQTALANKLDVGVQETLVNSFNEAVAAVQSAYLGIATTTTTPPATGAYWYRVDAPGTYTNFLEGESPITVTQNELDDNFVYFNVTNGVVSKELSKKPTVAIDGAIELNQITKAVNGDTSFRAIKTNQINTNITPYLTLTTGKYVDGTNGNIGNVSGYSVTEFIDISDIDFIDLNILAYQNYAFYTTNTGGGYISGSSVQTASITKPTNAKFVRFTIKDGEDFTIKLQRNVTGSVSIGNNASVSGDATYKAIKGNELGNDIMPFIKLTAGRYVDGTTGNDGALTGYSITEFIDISNIDILELNSALYQNFAYYTTKDKTTYICGTYFTTDFPAPAASK